MTENHFEPLDSADGDHARNRFMRADSNNRLVANDFEADWEAKSEPGPRKLVLFGVHCRTTGSTLMAIAQNLQYFE